MNPNKTEKGLGTTSEKQSTPSSVTMENQTQSNQNASQAAAPTSTSSFENAKGQTSPKALTATNILTGIEQQAPTTNPSLEQRATSSSESSEYEDDLPLPTFPYGPTDANIIRGIGPPAEISQAMPKKDKEFSITSLEQIEQKLPSKFPNIQRKSDPKTATSAEGVSTTGNNPIVNATVADTTGKLPFTLDTPIHPGVDTKILSGTNPGVQATVPDTTGKFQFTLNTPIPQQPVRSSAAKPFLFTREAKQPLEEAKFGPVKRRVFKPSRMEDDDDDAPKFPPFIFNLPESFASTAQDKKPVEDSKVLPVKSSLAEAFAIAPQAAKKPAEEQMIVPVKSSLAEAFIIAPQSAKEPAEENNHLKKTMEAVSLPAPKGEQGIGSLARTEASKKFTETENLLAEKQKEIDNLKDEIKQQKAKETESNGSMGKEIQEPRLKLQKREEVEVGALQNYEKSKGIYQDVSYLQAQKEQQARELESLRARLVKETKAKEKATSRANRLQKTINEQVDALREAGVKKAELLTMVDNQTAELAKYKRQQTSLQAEAGIGLVKEVMKGERARVGEEDKRREDKVQRTLEGLREGEQMRRQMLMAELESKDVELYDAKREVRELGQKLLASNQATAAALVAASASQISQSSSSSPPQASPSTPPSASTPSTTMPWFQLNLSPRRLLIHLFIFLLTFVIPLFNLNSLSQQATEEREVWQTAVVGPRDHRITREAQMLAMWEQNDPVMTVEEGWRRTREAARRYDEGF